MAGAARHDFGIARAKSDIHAVRILVMEPTSDVHARRFYSHANERLRILGEVPVRKFDKGGRQPIDPDGNPDTSFLAKVPADTPFTFQTLDKALSRILIGACDGYTGLDEKTLSLTADFTVDDLAAGRELGRRLKPVSPGVWELRLSKPIETLTVGTLVASVKDRQGNLARVERIFGVGPARQASAGVVP